MSEPKKKVNGADKPLAIDVQPYIEARKDRVDQMHDHIERICQEMIDGLEKVIKMSADLRSKEHDHIERTMAELIPMAEAVNGAVDHATSISRMIVTRTTALKAIEAAIGPAAPRPAIETGALEGASGE